MQTDASPRTILITGANKGIGYAIVEKLLQGQTPYDIILGARNEKLGTEAQSILSQKYSASSSKVTFRQIDVNDATSVDNLINWIKTHRNGKVDVLVNNAGIVPPENTVGGKDVRQADLFEPRVNTLQTNFFNTVRLTEKVLPALAKDGKVVNVSSAIGALRYKPEVAKMLESVGMLPNYKPEIIKILDNPTLTKAKLLETANALLEKTKEGKETELGWPQNIYSASKALLNAYTRWVLVKELAGDQQAYTLHPGWCQTDLGGPQAPDSVEEGAETPVYLISLPFEANDRLNGQFFEKSKVREF